MNSHKYILQIYLQIIMANNSLVPKHFMKTIDTLHQMVNVFKTYIKVYDHRNNIIFSPMKLQNSKCFSQIIMDKLSKNSACFTYQCNIQNSELQQMMSWLRHLIVKIKENSMCIIFIHNPNSITHILCIFLKINSFISFWYFIYIFCYYIFHLKLRKC